MNRYLSNNDEETDFSQYYGQIKKIYKKINENKNLDIDKINNNLNNIIENISKSKSFDDKKGVIKEIIDNMNTDEDYKILKDNNLLINLEILYELYSLDENEINLQLINSFELMDRLEISKHKLKFKTSSFLNFIKNRKKIIQELNKTNNYTKEFKSILSDKSFRNKIKIILNSSIVKTYYKNPKYYSNNKSECLKLIGDKEFIDNYQNFFENFIENNEIYEKIIFKRMPYEIKLDFNSYLFFILDPSSVVMNSNIKDKNYFLETYLIISFINETYSFLKRTYYMNKPLSIYKIYSSYEEGEGIIHNLLGEETIYMINTELCDKINDLNSWNAKTPEEIKIFKKSLKNIIKNMNLKGINREQLMEIKNKQNCLICLSNYENKNDDESKIRNSGSNNGFFCF